MTIQEGASPSGAERRRRPRQDPRKAPSSFTRIAQVAGELLMTVGALVLLYLAWELWWTNVESNLQQDQALAEFFATAPVVPGPDQESPADSADSGARDFGKPPVLSRDDMAAGTFAVIYIPRFGANYSRPVSGGVEANVLDNLGLGHYPDTSAPGELGNFALAGHRQTRGQVLDQIHTLVPGDKIFVQTTDGYYTYTFRNNQIVLPDRADVLAPVPAQLGAKPEQSVLTLTTCNPRFGSEERFIAYATMDSWRPASEGPPAAIAKEVAALANREG